MSIINQWQHNCQFNSLFRLHPHSACYPCEGNPPVTGGFPPQRASNAENVSKSWHHVSAQWLQSQHHIDGLVPDFNISSANALEILQSSTKPLILCYPLIYLCCHKWFRPDCIISIANALEILQSCNKPSILCYPLIYLCCRNHCRYQCANEPQFYSRKSSPVGSVWILER